MVVPPSNHPAAPRDSHSQGSPRQAPRDELGTGGTSETRGHAAPAAQKRGGAEGRVICETKRIRSHYRLLDVRQASRTLYPTPLRGRALQYTINDATMRLCGLVRLRRGRSPCLARSARGWKPLPQGSSSPSREVGEKDGHIPDRSTWFVHNAAYTFRRRCRFLRSPLESRLLGPFFRVSKPLCRPSFSSSTSAPLVSR